MTTLLRQTATFERASRASDGQGGWARTYSGVASGVKVHLARAGRAEQQLTDTEREKQTRRLHVDATFTPARDDRAYIDTGEVVLIRSVERPGGVPFVLGEHFECDCELIEVGT